MSAASESAASPSPCACTNISLMQLFHELKQKFPAVPDHVVSYTIELYCHDKNACETHLHREAKASLTHAYHASSSAAAKQLNEQKVNTPLKCPNQPIIKHLMHTPTAVNAVICQEPQTAILSSAALLNETDDSKKLQLNTDDNQNVVDSKSYQDNNVSPITTINIEECVVKYNKESPSESISSNKQSFEEHIGTPQSTKNIEQIDKVAIDNTKNEKADTQNIEQPESTNYKINKSNKIKCNLHEKLETSRDKIKIKKEDTPPIDPPPTDTADKPKRPSTLEFKPNPDIAFKTTLEQPEFNTNRSISPAPAAPKPEVNTTPGGTYWPERGYPLNLSVNVNCHMDYGRGYGPWLEEYDSPRAVTSVNLTVCTPTSNMASPSRDEEGGFEGHVTVTVSPSTARAPPRRRAPPPPQHQTPQPVEPQRNNIPGRLSTDITSERSLIERQKERLGRLAAAIAQEKGRLAQLTRETKILEAPPPTPAASKLLRDYVHNLRDQCNSLSKRLEMAGGDRDDFTGDMYPSQRGRRPLRPAPAAPVPPEDPPLDDDPTETPWQCHVCTFRNHPLLDKCEECDMPRILVGTSPTTNRDQRYGSFRGQRIDTNPFTVDVERSGRTCV